jgi:hypothetical protein
VRDERSGCSEREPLTGEVHVNDDRRRKRKEVRYLQSESVWLQKAVFALRKAEAARESLADVRDEEAEPYFLSVGDRELSIQDLDEALDVRVEALMKTVREMRRSLY